MMLLLWLIPLGLWYIYVARRMVQHLHMMQQNSYRNDRFWRWLKPRLKTYLLKRDLVAAVILLIASLSLHLNIVLVISIIVFALLNLTWKRPTEKKALSFTPRAKRLYGQSLLITAVFGGAIYLLQVFQVLDVAYALLLMGILAFISPWLHMAANLIMKPIEANINRGFLDDAKKIIHEMPNLTTIGITGSYGKTSSKFILGRIMSESYHTLVTPDSYNTPMGITITIRNFLKPIHKVFIAEMGARQKGDIAELCDLVQPKIGILTAIGPQHLETFGNLETVAKTKFELIDSLPANGLAVLNVDDEQIRLHLDQVKVRTLTYGLDLANGKQNKDYWAEDIGFSAQGMHFTVVGKKGQRQEMRTQLLGKHNIYNILAAVAVAEEMGMEMSTIARAVAAVPPVPHRLVLKRAGGFTIIDDAFNSNPVGAKMALEVLAAMPGGKKIIITPGMVELGSEEYAKNKEFAIACAKACDLVIIVGKKHSKALQDGIKEANLSSEKYYLAENLADGNAFMRKMVQAGDYVLFENDLPDTYL